MDVEQIRLKVMTFCPRQPYQCPSHSMAPGHFHGVGLQLHLTNKKRRSLWPSQPLMKLLPQGAPDDQLI